MSILAICSIIIFFLFLISYICVYHNLLRKYNSQPFMMDHYVILATTHLNLGRNFLFPRSNFQHSQCDRLPNGEELSVRRYEGEGSDEGVECAVCLCKIEEGDEIRELRCEHLFHRVCLDRWVGSRHITCPLCRDSLGPRRRATQLGEEVLVFKFCCFGSRDRELWWLR
ncbi:E3 ubiquitin-protein ligase RHA2B-like [Cornus florida]|uniref:E3 ubiquitin-protein ligase RHA2B-like n=1 Tax=Cornus florida TaxID=4283 RepID=UPI00289F6F6D|nr:E3 ubiquitin-protein ligase RHA2B-like [Cornus florida]